MRATVLTRGSGMLVRSAAARWFRGGRRCRRRARSTGSGRRRRGRRLDWFPGQPAGLLTAFCNGDRMDLLVVPLGSTQADALQAMELAAQALNLIRVPDILANLTTRPSPAQPAETEPELSVWEFEGGRLASRKDAT
jgi:hypothetical protein